MPGTYTPVSYNPRVPSPSRGLGSARSPGRSGLQVLPCCTALIPKFLKSLIPHFLGVYRSQSSFQRRWKNLTGYKSISGSPLLVGQAPSFFIPSQLQILSLYPGHMALVHMNGSKALHILSLPSPLIMLFIFSAWNVIFLWENY